MKRICFFPKYTAKGPSSRYRIYNYLDYYREAGYEVKVYPLFGDWYLDCIWGHRSKLTIIHRILWAYISRFVLLFFMEGKYVIHIQAELFPYMPYWVENFILKNKKYGLEYDDAIFHNYDRNPHRIIKKMLGDKIGLLIKNANYIVVGCNYLKDYALLYNPNVIVIPTSVNIDKYALERNTVEDSFIVGWIGSSSTSRFVIDLLPVFRRLSQFENFRLHLIGFDKELEYLLEGIPYSIIQWSDETEVSEIAHFSVGIMPLLDTPFNKGKCAFKLVQYMAVGIPTVSTPLQSNVDIDAGCGNLCATTEEEWYNALLTMMMNKDRFYEIGNKNRICARMLYSIQLNFRCYEQILGAYVENN